MSYLEFGLLCIASLLAYLVISGFVYALAPKCWYSGGYYSIDWRRAAATFWPLTVVGWLLYWIATIGPRVVERHRLNRERNRIPRAEVRR